MVTGACHEGRARIPNPRAVRRKPAGFDPAQVDAGPAEPSEGAPLLGGGSEHDGDRLDLAQAAHQLRHSTTAPARACRPVGAVPRPDDPGRPVRRPFGRHDEPVAGRDDRLLCDGDAACAGAARHRLAAISLSAAWGVGEQSRERPGIAIDPAVARKGQPRADARSAAGRTRDHDLVAVYRADRPESSRRITNERLAPELDSSVGRSLVSDPVDGGDEDAVRDGVAPLDGAPGVVLRLSVGRPLSGMPADGAG